MKSLENLTAFWCFQEIGKGSIGNQWVNIVKHHTLHFSSKNLNKSILISKFFAIRKLKHHCTKNKFSIKDFFSKCDQIRKKLRIWSHLLKQSLMENYKCLLFVIRIFHLLLGWKGCFPCQVQLPNVEYFCNAKSRSYIFQKIDKMKNVGPDKQSEMLLHVYIKFCC